jgi:hypothetical protein
MLIVVEEEHHEKRKYIPWPHMRIRNKVSEGDREGEGEGE